MQIKKNRRKYQRPTSNAYSSAGGAFHSVVDCFVRHLFSVAHIVY